MERANESMAPLSWFADAVGAEFHGDDAPVVRISIDSRSLKPGDLFVALRGDRFDGHDFAAAAVSSGAVGMMCDRRLDTSISQILVGDTLSGLQGISRAWRDRFSMPLIGITGSNGKTTTKQMLSSIVSARGPVLATRGNLNNHIGLPLTLLELREGQATAVIEMGANHAGEIALLAALARPGIGVVTQAGDAHLEGFGSRDGVAHAKGELFSALPNEGVAVINADDRYADLWRDMAQCQHLTFGMNQPAAVYASNLRLLPESTEFTLNVPGDDAHVSLPVAGEHNVMNALAAAACGVALGLEAHVIADGLERFELAQGRLVWRVAQGGMRVIDDSYNANPTSLRAGLELLARQDGQRIAVLGDMAELGSEAPELHEWCGAHARSLGIHRLLAIGKYATGYAAGFGAHAQTFDSIDALVAELMDLDAGAVALVKGSRSAGMDRVVTALCAVQAVEAH